MPEEDIYQRLATIETELKAVANISLLSGDLTTGKTRIDELLKLVSDAQIKADSEVLLACKAKQNCEEYFNAISQAKGTIDELLKLASAAQTKADSEALRAYQAKQNCEEHSNAISQAKGTIDAKYKEIQEIKSTSDEASRNISLIRTQAEEALKTIESKADSISKKYIAFETTCTNAETRFGVLSENSVQAEALVKDIRKLNDDSLKHLSEINQYKNTAESDAATIKASSEKIDKISQIATDASGLTTANKEKTDKILIEISEVSENLKMQHANSKDLLLFLESMKQQFADIKEKVEGLLPGATSATLASAFNLQRSRFKWPKIGWICTFIVCVLFLFGIAIPDFYHELFKNTNNVTPLSWDSLLLQLLHRLPLIFPLVWLAIYAGRNYMLTVRIEEDYAYKATVSTAFEGYKREMASIITDETDGKPVIKLCENILSAIAQQPGRIYEGKQHDITPFTSATAAIDSLSKLLVNKEK